MSTQEYLIAGIRNQQRAMKSLMNRFQDKEEFESVDGYVFSAVVKQVEKELKNLSDLLEVSLLDDLSKNFSTN